MELNVSNKVKIMNAIAWTVVLLAFIVETVIWKSTDEV